MEAEGRERLSPRWTITPVGGADKVPTFVALIGAQRGIKLATLIDVQKKDKQTIENLYKRKLLNKKNVHTFADFTGTDEADIEDMFSAGLYLKLVNGEFAKDLGNPIAEADLPAGARILVRVEQFLGAKPLGGSAKFSHYRPARYFTENSAALRGDLDVATLDRFEAAFKTLNALL
jgi:hypothetical protein